MPDERQYEITVIVKDAKEETVGHYEAPLAHKTVQDVAADLKGILDSRSGNKVRTINADR